MTDKQVEYIDYEEVKPGVKDDVPTETPGPVFDTYEFLDKLAEADKQLKKDKSDGWKQINLYVFCAHKGEVNQEQLFYQIKAILENKFGENCHVGAGSMQEAVESLETAYKVDVYCQNKGISVEQLIKEHEEAGWEDNTEGIGMDVGITNP